MIRSDSPEFVRAKKANPSWIPQVTKRATEDFSVKWLEKKFRKTSVFVNKMMILKVPYPSSHSTNKRIATQNASILTKLVS